MARFQVPQFIDIKPKIFGPFDFQQFIYVFIDGILIYIFIKNFNTGLAFFLSFITTIISFALGFLKINGLPFSKLLLKIINYFLQPQNYLWQKKYKTLKIEQESILDLRKKINLKEKLKNLSFKINLKPTTTNKTKEDYQVLKKITGEKVYAKKIDYL